MRKVPPRFTRSWASKAARSRWRSEPAVANPALATATSMPPNLLTVASTAASSESMSVMSAPSGSAESPIWAATLFAASWSTSTSATRVSDLREALGEPRPDAVAGTGDERDPVRHQGTGPISMPSRL